MCGQVLNCVSKIEHFASPGQVLVDFKTYSQYLVGKTIVEKVNDECFVVKQFKSHEHSTLKSEISRSKKTPLVESLKLFIPNEVSEKLLSKETNVNENLLTELRRVTVVFIRLNLKEQIQSTQHAFLLFKPLCTEIHKLSGSIRQFLEDGTI